MAQQEGAEMSRMKEALDNLQKYESIPSPARREEIARQIARKHFGAHAIGGSIFSDNATMDAIREATEALTKDIADALSAAPSSNGVSATQIEPHKPGAMRLVPYNLLWALWAYGCLGPVKGVIYEGGSHWDRLKEAETYLPAQTSLPSAPSSNGVREALERAPDPAFYKPDEFFKPYTIWFEQTRAAALRALPPAPVSRNAMKEILERAAQVADRVTRHGNPSIARAARAIADEIRALIPPAPTSNGMREAFDADLDSIQDLIAKEPHPSDYLIKIGVRAVDECYSGTKDTEFEHSVAACYRAMRAAEKLAALPLRNRRVTK